MRENIYIAIIVIITLSLIFWFRDTCVGPSWTTTYRRCGKRFLTVDRCLSTVFPSETHGTRISTLSIIRTGPSRKGDLGVVSLLHGVESRLIRYKDGTFDLVSRNFQVNQSCLQPPPKKKASGWLCIRRNVSRWIEIVPHSRRHKSWSELCSFIKKKSFTM